MEIQGADVTGRLAVGMPSWCGVSLGYMGRVREVGEREGRTSLDPLPKPFSTAPRMRRGKGASGPDAGPIMEARGVLGGIFAVWRFLRGGFGVWE